MGAAHANVFRTQSENARFLLSGIFFPQGSPKYKQLVKGLLTGVFESAGAQAQPVGVLSAGAKTSQTTPEKTGESGSESHYDNDDDEEKDEQEHESGDVKSDND